MTLGMILFYGGIVLFALALIALVVTNIILSVISTKLKALMDTSYGK